MPLKIFLGSQYYYVYTPTQSQEPSSSSNMDSNKKDIIFMLHSRQGSHKDVLDKIQQLANEIPSAYIVTFDLANHGVRQIDPTRNQMDLYPLQALDMYSQMLDAVNSISLALNLLPPLVGLREASFGKCIVVGASLSGHAALLALTHEPRVNAAVAFICVADFENLMKAIWLGNPSLKIKPFEEMFPSSLLELTRRVDVVHNLPKFQNKSFLMCNGEFDQYFPPSFNKNFIDSVLAAGSIKSLFKVYPKTKHQVTKEMLQDCIDFVQDCFSNNNKNDKPLKFSNL